MPSAYTITTLPKPKNNAVKLKEIPAKRYTVIRFSGTVNQKSLDQEQEKLQSFIVQKKLKPKKEKVMYAFFNPSWTLPFLRRNEIMIEIEI